MNSAQHLGDLIRPLLRRLRRSAILDQWPLPVTSGTLDEQERSWARTFVELAWAADRLDVVGEILGVLDAEPVEVSPDIALGRLQGAHELWYSVDQKRAVVYAMRAWVQACPCLSAMPALVEAGVGDPR